MNRDALPAASGRLLLVSADNIHFWTPGEALGPGLIAPRFDPALIRRNDCAVDPDGGVLVGEMERGGGRVDTWPPDGKMFYY